MQKARDLTVLQDVSVSQLWGLGLGGGGGGGSSKFLCVSLRDVHLKDLRTQDLRV